MNKWAKLIREWMLPAAIVLGISLYLVYHFSPALHVYGKWLHPLASEGQRFIVATLLFFQFVKVSPHDLKLSRWHLKALAIQVGLFLLCAGLVLLLLRFFAGLVFVGYHRSWHFYRVNADAAFN